MSKKLTFSIIVAILLVLGFLWLKRSGESSPDTFYRTQRVINNQLRIAVSATGTLNPVRVVNVGTQISGTIKEIYVDWNDEVEEGQVLLQLDDELYKAKVKMSAANLASAEAQLRLSQVQHDRQEKLVKQGYAPKEELDQAEATLEIDKTKVIQAEASLAQDQYNLNNTTIISPVAGVVINKAVDVGQTVAASFQTPTLIDIAQDLSRMQINASFAEADIGRLSPGLKASFTVDAYPGMNFEGKLRQIRLNPTTTSNVVTYDVVVDVSNPDLILLPGMTAYVDIELYREDNVLLVPNTALNFRPLPREGDPASLGTAAMAGDANGLPPGAAGPSSDSASGAASGPASDPAAASDAVPDLPIESLEHFPGAGPENNPETKVALGIPSKDDPPSKGRVYTLGKDNEPVATDLLLGATDLRNTVVRGGALKAGDEVIISETGAAGGTTLFGAAGGGGRGRAF
ncbi:MAG: efflux RND transporter periplasmic adaptor subunit [Deltaproteobacteria bacterium]|jgi:HlyD family secretion protein|nr:efflux RND transporter periplasmic adaptor subunit [Deltaproteobacteria bacterium]